MSFGEYCFDLGSFRGTQITDDIDDIFDEIIEMFKIGSKNYVGR
jgi:hypothetical protein